MMEKPPHETMVRLYRAAKELKQAEKPADVARLLGASDQSINNWSRRGMSKEGMLDAQAIIGCSATWLKTGKGPMVMAGVKHSPDEANSQVNAPNSGKIVKLPNARGNTIGLSRTEPELAIRGMVPMIDWERARTWDHTMTSASDVQRWLPCPAEHSASTFCIENNTETMDDGTASGYRAGEILFVDPEAQCVPDKDVIVILPDGKMLFRRFKEDGEGPYLLALNGRRIDRWQDGTSIRGIVIFSGKFR